MIDKKYFTYLVLLLLFIGLGTVPLIPFLPVFLTRFLSSIFILCIAATGWNIIGGYCGQFSLGHATFYGIGAYTAAHAWVAGLDPLLAMLLGGFGALFISLPFGLVTLRLRAAYFVIASIALTEVLRIIFLWRKELGGPEGITLPFSFITTPKIHFYICLTVLVASIFVAYRFHNSKFRLGFLSIAHNQDVAEEVGINTYSYKVLSLMISAFLCGLAGSNYSLYALYIYPSTVFGIGVSIDMMMASILGGAATVIGPLMGAFVIRSLDELLITFLPEMHMVVLGAFLIVAIILVPEGIVGIYHKLKYLKIRP